MRSVNSPAIGINNPIGETLTSGMSFKANSNKKWMKVSDTQDGNIISGMDKIPMPKK